MFQRLFNTSLLSDFVSDSSKMLFKLQNKFHQDLYSVYKYINVEKLQICAVLGQGDRMAPVSD